MGSLPLKIIWLFEDIEISTNKNNEFNIENNIPTNGFTRLTIKKYFKIILKKLLIF